MRHSMKQSNKPLKTNQVKTDKININYPWFKGDDHCPEKVTHTEIVFNSFFNKFTFSWLRY